MMKLSEISCRFDVKYHDSWVKSFWINILRSADVGYSERQLILYYAYCNDAAILAYFVTINTCTLVHNIDFHDGWSVISCFCLTVLPFLQKSYTRKICSVAHEHCRNFWHGHNAVTFSSKCVPEMHQWWGFPTTWATGQNNAKEAH